MNRAIEMQPSQIPRYFRSTEAHSSQNESFLESLFLVKIVPSLPVQSLPLVFLNSKNILFYIRNALSPESHILVQPLTRSFWFKPISLCSNLVHQPSLGKLLQIYCSFYCYLSNSKRLFTNALGCQIITLPPPDYQFFETFPTPLLLNYVFLENM